MGIRVHPPLSEEGQGVTGYQHESWHLRCVVPKLAEEMWLAAEESVKAGTQPDIGTMEEFLGLAPAPDCLY